MVPMRLEIQCKVTLPNYKYFLKRMDPTTTPGCRGLYLGYHVSCQAILEDNSYAYLVSFFNNI